MALRAGAGSSVGGEVDVLGTWAESLAARREGMPGRGCLRFAFYGRVSTEDWQDPATSRARQLQQAVMLVGGRGSITAEFFDTGQSRSLPWARRPQAAALVAQFEAGYVVFLKSGQLLRSCCLWVLFHGNQQQRHGAEVREPAGALSAAAAVLWSSIRIVVSVITGGLRMADP